MLQRSFKAYQGFEGFREFRMLKMVSRKFQWIFRGASKFQRLSDGLQCVSVGPPETQDSLKVVFGEAFKRISWSYNVILRWFGEF